MKTNLNKVYSKLPNKKTSLKNKKVDLGLIDEFTYDLSELKQEANNLENLTTTVIPDLIRKFEKAQEELYEVIVENSNDVLYLEEVNAMYQYDFAIINEIKEKSNDLGLNPEDIYPDINEYEEELTRLLTFAQLLNKEERDFNKYYKNI